MANVKIVAKLVAQEGKLFTDAVFVKNDMVGYIYLNDEDEFKKVCSRAITRRIGNANDILLNRPIKKTKTFQYFSLALDESQCSANHYFI